MLNDWSSFNPRTRDGCEYKSKYARQGTDVSIHAPVMGAKSFIKKTVNWRGFNPRTRDGCEALQHEPLENLRVSIHAPVMGANDEARAMDTPMGVSIHAPVMGAN